MSDKNVLQVMGDLIRSNTLKVKLTKEEEFTLEPIALKAEEIAEKLDELIIHEGYEDIKRIKGKKCIYTYSQKHMTDNYAKLLVQVEDGDLFSLIADTIRYDSKTYPRTTDIKLFTKSPYNFKEKDFLDLLEQLKQKEGFEDIKESIASNNAVYLYSEKYLSQAYADSLTEWIEVTSLECP